MAVDCKPGWTFPGRFGLPISKLIEAGPSRSDIFIPKRSGFATKFGMWNAFVNLNFWLPVCCAFHIHGAPVPKDHCYLETCQQQSFAGLFNAPGYIFALGPLKPLVQLVKKKKSAEYKKNLSVQPLNALFLINVCWLGSKLIFWCLSKSGTLLVKLSWLAIPVCHSFKWPWSQDLGIELTF